MRHFLLTLLYVASTCCCIAAGLPHYQRISLNHNDGLCDDYVRHINQDAHGYVWVVTNHGLNRFDGNSFKKYTKENSGLTTNELNCVLQDPDDPDLVWIGSRLDGLFCYDYATGEITEVTLPLHTSDITALAVASDGKIWITHYNFPPEKFDPRTKKLHRIFPSPPDGLPSRIWCSVEDESGRWLYLGHETYGMTRINLQTKEYQVFSGCNGSGGNGKEWSVYSLYVDGDGCVWAATDRGLYRYDPFDSAAGCGIVSDSSDHTAGEVRALHAMDDGVLWAGSLEGISVISSSGRRLLATSYAPSAIFEDSYGNKWVGYNGHGLEVLNDALSPVSFYYPSKAQGKALVGSPVWSVMTSASSDIWVGGEHSIAQVSGDDCRSYSLPVRLPQSVPVRCLYEDAEGTVWVGTYNAGAFRKRKDDVGFSAINDIDREVRDIVWMPPFGILAATHNGIYRIDDNGMARRFGLLNDQVLDPYIISLHRSSAGQLIVGTFGHGIIAFDSNGKIIRRMDKKDGMPSSTVNDIKESPDHKIWIATRDGIAVYDPSGHKLEKVIRTDDGVHSSNFKSIEFGQDGKVWISAEDGISCYDPATDRHSFFHRANKSLLGGFVEGASAVSSNGNIFFGSLNGMNVLDLNLVSAGSSSSKTKVTELRANDSKGFDHDAEISLPVNSGHISIPYNLNTFTITFSNPDISSDINTDIRYNMKGVNDVWTESDSRNEAVYRNLKPGKYEFRISTRYFGGEWSEPETLLTVTITPPPYLTWWAKILYAVLFLGVLALVFYLYKYKLDLEKNLEIERENSKINRLLNEEKLMFYTNVTHELRTPLSLIIGPIEDLINDPDLRDEHRRKLHTIRSSSIRLLNLINGILEFRKTETSNRRLEVTYGNLANFVREIALRFKELNNNRNVTFVIDVSQMEDREMYYDPEIITTVLNNLIGNAAKYTREGTITVALRPVCQDGVDYVDLIVTDTGEGIDPAELPHIFKRYYQAANSRNVSGTGIGLALVKNLVELHEGEIGVRSEVGKGSVFTVRLLADNSYPSARHKEFLDGNESASEVGVECMDDSPSADRLTVLVVEDDEDVRAYVKTSLEDTYKVLTAADGEEGWVLVKKEMPDMVVSDIMMPRLDGIELCRRIKNDSALNHIPVILLTAKDSILDREEGYESGADSYITKPFSSKLLLSRIHNIIEARHRLSILYLGMQVPVLENKERNEEGEAAGRRDAAENGHDAIGNENAGGDGLPLADREFIDKFKRLIEENIEQQELDIAFLTDKMCMSHSTLYRKVKSITGLTPNEFTRKVKLARAAQLLIAGVHDISRVSDLTGFNSPSYFRRVFKKEFGITPNEYIEQNNVISINDPT